MTSIEEVSKLHGAGTLRGGEGQIIEGFRPMRTPPSLSVGIFLTALCVAQTSSSKASLPRFEDIAPKAGLTVPHISSPDQRYIVEFMSGGVGLIDCDNDGKLDIITGGKSRRYLRHRRVRSAEGLAQDCDLPP